jgi:hypothetical protein
MHAVKKYYVTLMMEAMFLWNISSYKSQLKSYIALTGWAL